MSEKMIMHDDPDDDNLEASDKKHSPKNKQGESVEDSNSGDSALPQVRPGEPGQGPSTLGGGMSQSGGSTGEAGGASQSGGSGN